MNRRRGVSIVIVTGSYDLVLIILIKDYERTWLLFTFVRCCQGMLVLFKDFFDNPYSHAHFHVRHPIKIQTRIEIINI